jgi:predicted O-methyltransferase YrrM
MKEYKVLNRLLTIVHFLRYQVKAKHRKGRGIHSPFVFDLVNKVLSDRSVYDEYHFFQQVLDSLRQTKASVEVQDIGSPSLTFKNRNRLVSRLLSRSSVDAATGRLLFRLCRYYKPENIIELGTSIGLSALFMAKGSPGSRITTIEGNTALAAFAQSLFRKYRVKETDVRQGLFDEILPGIKSEKKSPRLVFIDGNHTYHATMKYFHFFSDWMEEGFLLFHDIHWSMGMTKAWKEIQKHPKSVVTIDLFKCGIVILNRTITPGHYTVCI